jgi:hypothetical protein
MCWALDSSADEPSVLPAALGEDPYPVTGFVIFVGTTTLLAICLHGIEAIIWAKAFRLLGALPDLKSAILYSLNAITSYVHTTLSLNPNGNSWDLGSPEWMVALLPPRLSDHTFSV